MKRFFQSPVAYILISILGIGGVFITLSPDDLLFQLFHLFTFMTIFSLALHTVISLSKRKSASRAIHGLLLFVLGCQLLVSGERIGWFEWDTSLSYSVFLGQLILCLLIVILVINPSLTHPSFRTRVYDVFAVLSLLLVTLWHMLVLPRLELTGLNMEWFERLIDPIGLIGLYIGWTLLHIQRQARTGRLYRTMTLLSITGFFTTFFVSMVGEMYGASEAFLYFVALFRLVFLASLTLASVFEPKSQRKVTVNRQVTTDFIVFSLLLIAFIIGSIQLPNDVIDFIARTALVLIVIRQFFVTKQNAQLSSSLRTSNEKLETTVKAKTRQLEVKEQQYRSLFAYNTEPIYLHDLSGKILSINAAGSELLGYSIRELIGQDIKSFFDPSDLEEYEPIYHRVIAGEPHQYIARAISRSGETHLWDLISVPMIIDGQVTGVYGIVKDVTQNVQQEQKIRYQATHDALSGLPNRFQFHERLDSILLEQKPFTLLFFDFDGFKELNDQYGHDVGDELIHHVGQRLERALGPDEFTARLGGDEFVVLACHDDADRINQAILDYVFLPPYYIDQAILHLSASIGIVSYPKDGTTSKTLLANADLAMYKAKESGKNQSVRFDPTLRTKKEERKRLIDGLDKALERDEISLHFQPQIDAHTQKVIGAEALMRWKKDGEFIPPTTFIPIAEETGHIIDLGRWTIEKAVMTLYELGQQNISLPKLSINISVRQLFDDNLVSFLQQVLKKYPISKELLRFELTETIAANRSKHALARILELKELGISLSIDDFGTGYSSLAYLVSYPLDELKIPREFTMRLEEYPEYRTITATIVAMAKQLNMTLVAEGVETAYQENFLREEGCTQMQGFRYAKPMPISEFVDFYVNQPIS